MVDLQLPSLKRSGLLIAVLSNNDFSQEFLFPSNQQQCLMEASADLAPVLLVSTKLCLEIDS